MRKKIPANSEISVNGELMTISRPVYVQAIKCVPIEGNHKTDTKGHNDPIERADVLRIIERREEALEAAASDFATDVFRDDELEDDFSISSDLQNDVLSAELNHIISQVQKL